jgi:hypothetical protein
LTYFHLKTKAYRPAAGGMEDAIVARHTIQAPRSPSQSPAGGVYAFNKLTGETP